MKNMLAMFAMYSSMAQAMGVYNDSHIIHNGIEHIYHEWDKVQLTKKERSGKTYEELQKIRKEKWEVMH